MPPDTLVAVASPQRAIEGLLMAAEATPDAWGSRTAVNLPALTVRVSEMLDALEVAAGRAARERVRFEEDPNHSQDDVGMACRLRKRPGTPAGSFRRSRFPLHHSPVSERAGGLSVDLFWAASRMTSPARPIWRTTWCVPACGWS